MLEAVLVCGIAVMLVTHPSRATKTLPELFRPALTRKALDELLIGPLDLS